MGLFGCNHKWEVVSTDYTPPREEFKIKAYDLSVVMETLTQGVTHIYQKCTICGEIKETKVYGKFSSNQTQ